MAVFRMQPVLIVASAILSLVAAAPTLTAELDYGTFEGAHDTKYNLR